MHPLEYAAQTLKGVLAKVPQLDPAEIEDVIVGCAVQTGKTSMNMGKLLAARAGLPQSVAAQTINRFCSSGLQAIATAQNEAFASHAIYCIRELGMDPEKVNPYGGAIALGHPMGATGAFLTAKVLDYLQDQDKKYGMVTMCIGGGMGAAGIFERL